MLIAAQLQQNSERKTIKTKKSDFVGSFAKYVGGGHVEFSNLFVNLENVLKSPNRDLILKTIENI